MNIKKYASHSKFKGFGCEIVNNRYPQTYSPTDNYYLPKHLNLNQDSKVLIYLAEPIIMSASREGKVTKRIIKFLRNYK